MSSRLKIMPSPTPSLNYQRAWITIAPQNFTKSCDFYQQLLGKAPDRTMTKPGNPDRFIYAEFQLAGLTLGLYEPKNPQTGCSSSLSLCFQVDNLENAIALVTSLGYPPPGEIMTPSHGREVYAFDPDDNRLILYQANSNTAV
jgi:predicted enzyme related to lactoylglutathione lyase